MDFCLKRLQQGITAATKDLTPENLLLRPFAGKWNAGEVLEHLYLTYTGTTRGMEKCLAAGKPLARMPTWKDRARTLYVVGLGRLPEGRKAPAGATPKGMSAEQVLREIHIKLAEMEAAIARAEETFGRNTRLLDHPVLGPLTGPQWRRFHLVHGQLHLRQLARLRKGCDLLTLETRVATEAQNS
ncbi:MAG TPA: DinB family protein [Terriglobales bacterium]|nr:DinB family protein [Terriglobales bacterium]